MNKTKSGQTAVLSIVGILVSVVAAYISAVLSLPSLGILTTLPASAVFALVASFICKKRKTIYLSMAVMPFLATLLFGFGIKRAIITALLSAASAFFAILAKRAVITICKSESDSAKSKSKIVLFVSVILIAVLWLGTSGNPVSLSSAESDNKNIVKERYGGTVKTGSTYFEVTEFAYLTEITFESGDPGKKYYISAGKRDDYLNFHIKEAYLDAIDYFAGKTALAKDDIRCFIDKDSFIFGRNGDTSENFINADYLIARNEKVVGMNGFKQLHDNLMYLFNESGDINYKSYIMTATDMNGKVCYAFKEYGKEVVFSVDNAELAETISEKFN